MSLLLTLLLAQARPHTDPGPPSFLSELQPHIARYEGQLTYCYETRLKSNATLEGRVEIAVRVDEGRITASTVHRNTTGDVALGDCIAKKVGYWRLPPELSGEAVMPFVFEPAEEEAPKPAPRACTAEEYAEGHTPTDPDCVVPASEQRRRGD